MSSRDAEQRVKVHKSACGLGTSRRKCSIKMEFKIMRMSEYTEKRTRTEPKHISTLRQRDEEDELAKDMKKN